MTQTSPGRDGRRRGGARRLWVALALLAFAPAYAAAQAPAAGEPQPEAPAAGAPASAGAAPQVEEWINQTLPVREATTVYLTPDETADTHGKLAPGAQVRVIATLAGGGWLQVRLPDDSIGYVKASTVTLAQATTPNETAPPAADTGGGTAPGPGNGQAPAVPTSEEQPGAAPPAPAAGGAQPAVPADTPTPMETGEPAEIDGRPLVRDTATLVIDGHAVLLAGIEGVGGEATDMVQDHIAAHGDSVSCKAAQDMPGFYYCTLADGTDLGKLLLVNGFARIAAGAPDDYAPQQDAAEQAQKGIWALPDTCARWAISESVATVAYTDDADEGLYFYNLEPYVLLFGEPVPILFDAAFGGWGYFGADHQWNAAPGRWAAHLNNVYPGGKGLRSATARAADLKGGAVHGAALHEAEAHQHSIGQQHAIAEKLGRAPVAPENTRPTALTHGAAGAAGQRPGEAQRPEGQRPGAGQRPGEAQRPGEGQRPGAAQRPGGEAQRPGGRPGQAAWSRADMRNRGCMRPRAASRIRWARR